MHVALTQDDVVLAAHLDLIAILGAEQHLIALFHRPHVGTHGNDLGPHEPFPHLCGGRDEDPTGRASLTLGSTEVDEDSIVEHLDREFLSVDTDTVGQSIRGLR